MAGTQGELVTAAPRANRHGNPCPRWCVTDHHVPWAETRLGPVYEDVHKSAGGSEEPLFGAYVRQFSTFDASPGEAEVVVRAGTAFTGIPAAEAVSLAAVLATLGDLGLTPAQLRQLAARVREAARTAGTAK